MARIAAPKLKCLARFPPDVFRQGEVFAPKLTRDRGVHPTVEFSQRKFPVSRRSKENLNGRLWRPLPFGDPMRRRNRPRQAWRETDSFAPRSTVSPRRLFRELCSRDK